MRLAIVHYHLRPGGVTRVIANALTALGQSLDKAVVLSSTESDEPLPCPVAVIPELAYTRKASRDQADSLYRALRKAAQKHLGADPDIWHVHNHSLGKNVNFPQALRQLAEDNQRILLQIHDFAEDGRPGNYLDQKAPFSEGVFPDWKTALYPKARHIGYAVLNGRDRTLLQQAGLPADHLFWLPNAVSAPSIPSEPTSEKPKDTRPLILYPTRGIRRKNLGELLLMASVYPDFRYATTLAPDNPQWAAIHEGWVALARELELPVGFALATEPGHSFEGLLQEAGTMVTTSVGEGFGLAFLEPWLLGKPVIGRDLPEITSDFKDNGIVLPDLYEAWPVSTDLFNLAALRARFFEALHSLYADYHFPLSKTDATAAWQALVSDGTIDFGRLDELAQAEVIRSVRGSPRTRISAPIDPGRIDTAPATQNAEAIKQTYGFPQYKQQLLRIYSDLMEAEFTQVEQAQPEKILEAFLSPERMCLLRT